MQKLFWIIPLAVVLLGAAYWGYRIWERATMQSNVTPIPENPKILIVYYSHSGNTKALAQMIHSRTGADLFEIEVEKPYPTDYSTIVKQAKEELNNGYLPPIKSKIENLADYDTIFLGSPNWWSTIALPVMTFLENHDLSGKTVVPFVTHGGGGVANCIKEMEKRAAGAQFAQGLVLRDSRVKSSEESVSQWLRETHKITSK